MAEKLFTPISYGAIGPCANRIVMAPLTRLRADPVTGVLPEYSAEYYRQRAEAGLIIVEATNISPIARGYAGSPGIFTPEQIARWKQITEEVHKAGGKLVCQFWHTGVVGHESLHPGTPVQGPSSGEFGCRCNIIENGEIVRSPATAAKEMSLPEIDQCVLEYAQATRNAREAGFDGVEIHAAHGYLLNSFMCGATNKRTDEYGCQNFENRVRLLMRVIDACKAAWEGARVGVRVSPIGVFNNIPCGPDTIEFTEYLFKALDEKRLAYVHLSEPEWARSMFQEITWKAEYEVNDALYEKMRGWLQHSKFIGSGGYDRQKAISRIERFVDAVAFGRAFITNPDLVNRIRLDLPVAPFEPTYSYKGGEKGYIDYPRYGEASPASTAA